MKKNDLVLSALPLFLSMLNLDMDDKENFISLLDLGNDVSLYDENGNCVGKIFKQGEEFYIQVMFKNKYFSAASYADKEKGEYGFKYDINSLGFRKKLIGEFAVREGLKLDKVIIKNSLLVFIRGKFIGKCTFDTQRNVFKFYNAKNKEEVRYRNNEFIHETKDATVKINNYYGTFVYLVQAGEEDSFGGCSFVDDYADYNYTDCEIEFRRLLEEIDEPYFSFLIKQKRLLNKFKPGFFEKVAQISLKNYNDEQLQNMLDIDTGYQKVK